MWLLGKNNRIETVKKKFLSGCEGSFFFLHRWIVDIPVTKHCVFFNKIIDNNTYAMYVIDRMFYK